MSIKGIQVDETKKNRLADHRFNYMFIGLFFCRLSLDHLKKWRYFWKLLVILKRCLACYLLLYWDTRSMIVQNWNMSSSWVCFFQRPYILIFLLQCELKMDSITLSKKHQPKEELIFRGFTFSAIENALS